MNVLFSTITVFGTILLFSLCLGCSHLQRGLMAAQGMPREAQEVNPSSYAHLFETHCARCHGQQGQGDGPDAHLLKAEMPNFSDGSFTKSLGITAANISYGKRQEMPGFRDVLSEREIWILARYIKESLPPQE